MSHEAAFCIVNLVSNTMVLAFDFGSPKKDGKVHGSGGEKI